MTFQEKTILITDSFATLAEKFAYIKGLGDGLQQGRDICLGTSNMTEQEKQEILDDKIKTEMRNGEITQEEMDNHDCHLSPEDGCDCQNVKVV